MSDEFDKALEEAIEAPDRDVEIDLGDDDGAAFGGRDEGGGDIDDARPAHLDAARQTEVQLQQATTVREQWKAEHDKRETTLKELQQKYLKTRKDVLNGAGSEEDEIAAQDAVLEARYQLDKARDSLGQAQAWQESIANAPKLTPAQQDWLSANPRYNSDTAFQKQAQQHMRSLANEGLDPTHPTFYRKLDERMRQQPRMGQDSRRTPGAPAIRSSSNNRPSGETMTEAEAKFVSKLGYDPKDKTVADQWRRSKGNTKRIAQKRGFL